MLNREYHYLQTMPIFISVWSLMVCAVPSLGQVQMLPTSTIINRISDLDDFVSLGMVLFHSPVASIYECTDKCAKTDRCLAFTYSQRPPSCRGYYCAPSLSDVLPSPGSSTWTFRDTKDISAGTNFALWKPAWQSKTWSKWWYAWASLAVDGDPETYSHTWHEWYPRWQVDLQTYVPVRSVTIINRPDCCGNRLHDFLVEVLDDQGVFRECYNHEGAMHTAETKTIHCYQPICGNVVRIRKTSRYLALAEVQVRD